MGQVQGHSPHKSSTFHYPIVSCPYVSCVLCTPAPRMTHYFKRTGILLILVQMFIFSFERLY